VNIQLLGSFSKYARLFFEEISSTAYKERRWVVLQAVTGVNFPPTTVSGTDHKIRDKNQRRV